MELDLLGGELFSRRMVMLNGVLDEAVAIKAAAQLMTLDAAGNDPVDIYVTCREGTLEAAFVLIDTLDLMQAPTRTHALGEVGGPAVGVLAAGRQRISTPSAGFHLVEPRVHLNGSADQLVARSEQHRQLVRKFRARLASATGRPVAAVGEDLERQVYLDAEQALAYGLIDEIQGSQVPKAFIY